MPRERGIYRGGQMSNRQSCEQCQRAATLVRGGKCAMHESSTSPSVDRALLERIERPVVGPIGPVPYVLAGGRIS